MMQKYTLPKTQQIPDPIYLWQTQNKAKVQLISSVPNLQYKGMRTLNPGPGKSK